MGKLSQISGNVSMTLDKLSGIRGDLVRTDPEWESWDFLKLCEALHQLINTLKIKPCEIKRQRIDMLVTSKTANMELYDLKIASLDGNHEMNVQLTKVEKGELLCIGNPGYDQLIKRYQHLQPVKMDDRDTKQQLPIHLVLGSGEYARIKTSTKPLVGKENERIAEKTKLGWFIMSPGVEFDKSTMLLTQTSQADFEKLCRLDVLGIADSSEHDQTTVYEDFKENLTRDSTGWYEANLPWKPNHPPLPTNESGSRRRLDNLIKRLKRKDIYKQYDEIIQDQLDKGIVEPAPPKVSGKEFYIPHKGVEKQTAETKSLFASKS